MPDWHEPELFVSGRDSDRNLLDIGLNDDDDDDNDDDDDDDDDDYYYYYYYYTKKSK
jgi:hypothetical protein